MLLLMTFTITSPTVPRILAIAIGLLGVATAFGFIPVRGPQDYYGGLVLMMLAVLALIASAELPGQRGFAFGPGTAPRLFAIMLFGLSVAVTIVGVSSVGPAIEKYKLRGPLCVLFAICLFAAIIRPVRAGRCGFLTWMISIFGSTEMRWIESVIAAAAMTVVLRRAVRLPAQSSVPALAAAECAHAALCSSSPSSSGSYSGRS